MKKHGSGILTIALFVLAAALLSFSVVGSSQAVLQYTSATYGAQVEMFDIGVTLVENDSDVSWRDYTTKDDVWNENTGALVGKMLTDPDGTQQPMQIGQKYKEELSVRNSGTIDHYMRVTVYKYWADNVQRDANGNITSAHKRTDLDPSLIDLHYVNTDSAWYLDEEASTDERTVLYYRGGDGGILAAGGQTVPFTDTLEIQDEGVQQAIRDVVQYQDENGNTVVRTSYDYDGLTFIIQANVDAVQTHNAPEAIRSAWGVEMASKGMG